MWGLKGGGQKAGNKAEYKTAYPLAIGVMKFIINYHFTLKSTGKLGTKIFLTKDF